MKEQGVNTMSEFLEELPVSTQHNNVQKRSGSCYWSVTDFGIMKQFW